MKVPVEIMLSLAALLTAPRLTPAADQPQEVRSEEFKECINGLRSPDGELREASAMRVPLLGAEAKHALWSLLVALGDKSPSVRAAVARALGSFGEGRALAIPALAHALGDDDPFVARNAGRALCLRSPSDRAALHVLGAALQRGDDLKCYGAIFGLRARPAVAARFTPALASIVDSGAAWLRLEAIRTIATIGPGAWLAEPSLIRVLSTDDGEAVLEATWALVSLSSASPAAIEALETVSRRENPELRAACSLALFDAKRLDRRMLAANLQQALPRMQDPLRCLQALRRKGTVVVDLVPAVASLMRHGDGLVQREVLMTLAAIGRDVPATKRVIMKGLRAGGPEVRCSAARELRRYVHEPRWALRLLIPLLDDADFAVGRAATVSLACFGRSLVGVIPELTRALGWRCPDPVQAIILLRVLGSLGGEAASAIAKVEAIAASDLASPEVRQAAQAALACISGGATDR